MKNLTWIFMLLLNPFFAMCQTADSGTYTKLEEALKRPDNVKKLDLSNQSLDNFPAGILQLRNLEVLILKNDRLKSIPKEIGQLKNLKVLDLSGNDFERLPDEFVQLQNLQELYLNDDPAFNLDKGSVILSSLSSLRILHLENDNLESLPPNFYNMMQLEKLYINNNALRAMPEDMKKMKNLNFIKVSDNKHMLDQDKTIHDWGVKIEF